MSPDDLVQKVAGLMHEQTIAFERLESTAAKLSNALIGGPAAVVETLTQKGESELLRMCARLYQITATLSAFAEARAKVPDKPALETETRQKFESAANDLLTAARSFQKISRRSLVLTQSGTSFASACLETCGVPPITYRAPVLRREENEL
jgi:hypothetical protein